MSPDGFPVLREPAWSDGGTGPIAGITLRGSGPGGAPADFGLATTPSAWDFLERIEALAHQLGFPGVALVRQVHGDTVVCVEATPEGGVRIAGEADGLLTASAGLLLVVTAADCVPVYLLDPDSGGIALLHAGWRGTAEGVLRSGVRSMAARFGSRPERLRVHLGPAICGTCYEVGPEVLGALGRPAAEDGGTVDLRSVLAERAEELGVAADRVTRSTRCSRCEADHFHSHRGRGESAGRMAAFIGRSRPSGGDVR